MSPLPEIARAFGRLGLTSFGGPAAHMGYFRAEFVTRRGWLSETDFAALLAFCQFLPGPASSQLGFAIGWQRGGPLGALVAFAAFTAPSALAMALLAGGIGAAPPWAGAALAGLKITAVAVVAQAVWSMARGLVPDAAHAGIAALAAGLVLALPGAGGQMGAIALGLLAGLALARPTPPPRHEDRGRVPARATALVAGLALAGLAIWVLAAPQTLAARMAQAGALVFGGGHVVLPLLQATTADLPGITPPDFLAGYGAAQALPGPLFTFAAYLGALTQGGWGALVALAAIFAPGFLLLIAVWPFWARLAAQPPARAAIGGANAAMVGLLAAALADPLIPAAIHGPATAALALALAAALISGRLGPLGAVLIGSGGGLALAAAGLS
ncbi:chromate efflux transporter [Phaeovulum vinaykumarii]|uniref:Chromate transporter n=1 Tax=Phaeovulum vinaykumarii TaxID=407234 RepID=A0A1N7JTH8_9RHOB|nr:chromate efflux transporter [Phaeovulum vinaykumarii]SIS52571.1 chromate transporter [Phaeovulum vinaykumarii]SOB91275.1 chromate transporter [Phaeovulum vinaykumarii]